MSQLSSMATDRVLVESAVNGDPAAMNKVAAIYFPLIRDELRFHPGARGAEDDITSEASLSLIKYVRLAEQLDLKVNFRSVVRTIIKRRVLDHLREQKRHPDFRGIGGTDHLDRAQQQEAREEKVDPLEDFVGNEEWKAAVIARLEKDISTRQFEIFVMAFDVPRWESFPTQKEIARTLGLSAPTVNEALTIAKRRFKKILQEELERKDD